MPNKEIFSDKEYWWEYCLEIWIFFFFSFVSRILTLTQWHISLFCKHSFSFYSVTVKQINQIYNFAYARKILWLEERLFSIIRFLWFKSLDCWNFVPSWLIRSMHRCNQSLSITCLNSIYFREGGGEKLRFRNLGSQVLETLKPPLQRVIH